MNFLYMKGGLTPDQGLALLPIIILSVTIVVVACAIAIKRHHWWNATISVAGLNLALLPLFVHFWLPQIWTLPLPQTVTPLFNIDGYACFYMAMILVTALATATLLHAYMEGYAGNKEEVYLLLLLSALGGLTIVCSRHFASFFIGLELLSVPLYGMTAYLVKERRSLEAGTKYLVLSAVASAFILFGMALIYSQTGTLLFAEIGARAAAVADGGRGLIVLGSAMILVGVGFKLSLAPFHLWTPDVYEGAPAPITSYLATASKTAVFALLVRYFVEAHANQYHALVDVLSVLAIASIVVGNVLALQQDNIKRLLAYSSIAHFGYLLVALIASGPLAVETVGIYLLTYVVTTLAAFGVITLMSSPYGERDAEALFEYRGLFWRRPYLASILTVALLSLAGVPLTAGFIGKFYIVAIGADQHLWLLLAAVVFGSAVGLYYYLRAMASMYLRQRWVQNYSAPLNWAQGTGGTMLILLALAMLLIGIFPSPFIALVQAGALH